MMRFRHLPGLRLGLAAALLVGSAGVAQARANVSVDLNVGYPSYYGAPVLGGVSVGYGHGYGYRGYHGYRGGWGWGPRFIIGAPIVAYGYGYGVPVAPPVVVAEQPPATAPLTLPEPIIYPRSGQDAQQTEYDRQACNRWATTQPAAVADASVFQRAVAACMDGRGYSMK